MNPFFDGKQIGTLNLNEERNSTIVGETHKSEKQFSNNTVLTIADNMTLILQEYGFIGDDQSCETQEVDCVPDTGSKKQTRSVVDDSTPAKVAKTSDGDAEMDANHQKIDKASFTSEEYSTTWTISSTGILILMQQSPK